MQKIISKNEGLCVVQIQGFEICKNLTDNIIFFVFKFYVFLSASLARACASKDQFFLSPDFDEIDNTCGF